MFLRENQISIMQYGKCIISLFHYLYCYIYWVHNPCSFFYPIAFPFTVARLIKQYLCIPNIGFCLSRMISLLILSLKPIFICLLMYISIYPPIHISLLKSLILIIVEKCIISIKMVFNSLTFSGENINFIKIINLICIL